MGGEVTTTGINDAEREYYALWWEYLKRSPDYKKFCKLHSAKKQYKGPMKLFNQFFLNFKFMGDVHRFDFDDWWQNWQKDRMTSPSKIWPAEDVIKEDIKKTIDYLKWGKKRKPTLEKFSQHFLQDVIPDPLYFYVKIPLIGLSINEIKNQLFPILESKKKSALVKSIAMYTSAYDAKSPLSRLRPGELRRYLEVYDMHINDDPERHQKFKKMKPEYIAAKSIRRGYFSDLEKARRIIKNVEKGIFPGKY